jgi:hypothetical protein
MAQQATEFFKDLFSRATVMGEFVHAMRTTFIVAIVVLAVGSLVALLIRNHVTAPAAARTESVAGETGLLMAEAREPLAEGDLVQEDWKERSGKENPSTEVPRSDSAA